MVNYASVGIPEPILNDLYDKLAQQLAIYLVRPKCKDGYAWIKAKLLEDSPVTIPGMGAIKYRKPELLAEFFEQEQDSFYGRGHIRLRLNQVSGGTYKLAGTLIDFWPKRSSDCRSPARI